MRGTVGVRPAAAPRFFLSAVHASETSARRGFAARHARALPYLSVRSRVSATRPPPSFFTPAYPALAAACLYASFPALFPPCKWPLWDLSLRAQFRPAFCVRPRLFCRSARRPRLPRNAACFASVAYAAQVPSFSMRAVRSGPPRRAAARLVSRRAAPVRPFGFCNDRAGGMVFPLRAPLPIRGLLQPRRAPAYARSQPVHAAWFPPPTRRPCACHALRPPRPAPAPAVSLPGSSAYLLRRICGSRIFQIPHKQRRGNAPPLLFCGISPLLLPHDRKT